MIERESVDTVYIDIGYTHFSSVYLRCLDMNGVKEGVF